jgi:hypothetical protein
MSEIATQGINCSNCGAGLSIPPNFRKGTVRCNFCETDTIVTGLQSDNAEIAKKENINSGFPLTATPEMLHRVVVEQLTGNIHSPLDLLENIEITDEKKFFVPAYCFYCNGTAPFTYEVGSEVKRATEVKKSGNVKYETETVWTHESGSANITATLFSPGNKETASQINALYFSEVPHLGISDELNGDRLFVTKHIHGTSGGSPEDARRAAEEYLTARSKNIHRNWSDAEAMSIKLVDVEDLNITADSTVSACNIPLTASFNEYIRPRMEEQLKQAALKQLEGRECRGLNMGGSNIVRESEVRVLLGMFQIVCKYGGQEFSVYTNGDASIADYDSLPRDEDRAKIHAEKTDAIVSYSFFSKESILLMIAIGICALAAVVSLFKTAVFSIIFILIAIIPSVFLFKAKKGYDEQISAMKSDLAQFESPWTDSAKAFSAEGKKLNGIYNTPD